MYRGTSLMRKCTPLGPYRRPMPRVIGGGGGVLLGEAPMQIPQVVNGPNIGGRIALPWIQGYLAHKKTPPLRSPQ